MLLMKAKLQKNIVYCINKEIIKKEEIYDGYYELTTNLIGEIEEILNICFKLF